MSSIANTVRSYLPTTHGNGDHGDSTVLPTHNGRSRSQRLKEKLTPSAVVKSYAWDWSLVVIFWVILGVLNQMGGHKREFSLNDISIQHTFAEVERVNEGMLVFISLGIPLLGLVPIGAFVYKSGWDVHNSVLGLLMSYTFTGFVTQLIKMHVGRPRPDLINRCLPAPGSADHPVYGLSTHEICTSTNAFILNDGFKSFPSGHSSLSFAGLGFLTFYLCGKLHLYDRRGHRTRAWLALAPCLGATMVAVSRTMDNRHHWQDVLVGSTLGLCISYIAYRAYFPRLSHKYAHLPLAPRAPSAAPSEAGSDSESERGHGSSQRDQRIRLMSTDDVVPRRSEEEQAWGS